MVNTRLSLVDVRVQIPSLSSDYGDMVELVDTYDLESYALSVRVRVSLSLPNMLD